MFWLKLPPQIRLRRKLLTLTLLALLGLSFSGLLPHPPLLARATPTVPLAQAQPSLDVLIQQAENHYAAENFALAEKAWQQVAAILQAQSGPKLKQVRALSNLSFTQQKQSKWTVAEANIDQALELLDIPVDPLPLAIDPDDRESFRVLAQSLDIRGNLYYLTGRSQRALVDWQRSYSLYQQLEDDQKDYQEAALKNLLNQAQAYQSLGQYLKAKANLKAVEEPLQEADLKTRVTLLHSLANTKRLIGELPAAVKDLEAAKRLIETVPVNSDNSALHLKLDLDLGNVQQDSAIRSRDLVKPIKQTQKHITDALQAYEAAASQAKILSSTPGSEFEVMRLQGSLNQLRLRLTFVSELAQNNYDPNNWLQIENLVQTITTLFTDPLLPINRKTVYSRIHFAELLMHLAQAKTDGENTLYSIANAFDLDNLHHQSLTHLTQSIEDARELQDFRAEANAMGYLGELYGHVGELVAAQDPTDAKKQWQHAYQVLKDAIALSTDLNAPDLSYRWHRQVGQLLNQQDYQFEAINAYRAAVADLQKVRINLLAVNSEVQFSFRDNVEPVYREFIELLLAVADENTDGRQELIKEALKNFDELQLAEINNYLECDSGESVSLGDVNDVNAGIIYMILLHDRIGIILDLPKNNHLSTNSKIIKNNRDKSTKRKYILYFHPKIPIKKIVGQNVLPVKIEDEINKFRSILDLDGQRPKIIEEAKILYEWLLAPIMVELKNQPALKTLVFVPDGILRNLPMHVLHDGSRYLIQTFNVVVSPRIELFNPRKVEIPPTFFLGGFGEEQTINDIHFDSIQLLTEELVEISMLDDSDYPPLINEGFTSNNIKREIQDHKFSVVHLKAHGVFSSDPQETFIAGNNEPILGRQLGNLIKSGSINNDRELDLLGLSACKSAQGDNRAVLGLTGVAVRAGARSVISSLWVAEDSINTEIMPNFYKAIYQDGLSRAEAFRKIIVNLIEKTSPDQPQEWATYILVGNWL